MNIKQFAFNSLKKIGVDKSIAYSSGARVVQAFTGVASILFVSTFLTGVEQGFYYTFGSIVAIQVFFELGLTNIITQYVAHEASHLEWKEDKVSLKGVPENLSRLAHLLRFSVKWYTIIAALLFVALFVVGIIFFGHYSDHGEDVSWQWPWILVCIGAAGNLFIAPLLAILMGLEKVKEVSRIHFYRQIIIPSSSWLGLAIGFKLYVLGISSILSVILVFCFAYFSDLGLILKNLWKEKVVQRVGYMSEIFPYQWKIALSWVSGYFIFQLFNPVLFATEGAVVAGQMGMTLAAINGIQAFSLSWISTKIPKFSKLIALKEYFNLDSLFNKTVKQMCLVCLGLICIFISAVYTLRLLNIPLGYRFLSWLPMTFMLIALFINQLVNAWATYLRCHKNEPFLVLSIVGGILCCLSTLILGNIYGVIGMTAGYCTITIGLFIWGYYIFIKCKKIWHEA